MGTLEVDASVTFSRATAGREMYRKGRRVIDLQRLRLQLSLLEVNICPSRCPPPPPTHTHLDLNLPCWFPTPFNLDPFSARALNKCVFWVTTAAFGHHPAHAPVARHLRRLLELQHRRACAVRHSRDDRPRAQGLRVSAPLLEVRFSLAEGEMVGRGRGVS